MTKVWRALTRNLGWKVLSVLLAITLWIAVDGEPELVTLQSVPVFYQNVESNLALVANPPAAIRIELRGASDVLSRENLANVAVLLDLAGLTEPGERVFPVTRANITLPAGVRFERSDPSELRLHLDRTSKGNPPPQP